MSEAIKLFIVEGEDRDLRFIKEMTQTFFKGKFSAKIIQLPAAQNIYMLYQKLEEDSFETDVVEVVRDTVKEAEIALNGIQRQEIDEVYLFFDYDLHHNNLKKNKDANEILINMLQFFNNETDSGKLYISYPMVEALYDYRDGMCQPFSSCFIKCNDICRYKELSGNNNPKASIRRNVLEWKMILAIFALRINCLFGDDCSFEYYRNSVFPETILEKQQESVKEKQAVFVLSALPEFLLDYFKIDFWNTMINLKKCRFIDCPLNNQDDDAESEARNPSVS